MAGQVSRQWGRGFGDGERGTQEETEKKRGRGPRRAKKEPPMRQDIKKERLSKKYFSRSRKWFTLSNAAERSSRMSRNQVITRIGPKASWEESGWRPFQLSEDSSQMKREREVRTWSG